MRIVVQVWEGRWAGVPVITTVVNEQVKWADSIQVEVGYHQYVTAHLRDVTPERVLYEQDRPEEVIPLLTPLVIPGVLS